MLNDTVTVDALALAALRIDNTTWRARYLAAHEILVLLAAFLDDGYHLADRVALESAFAAYRQSIEVGAPVAWQVAPAP